MNYKNLLISIGVCLFLSVLVISFGRYFGESLKDIFVGLFVYALYVSLIVFYLLRFALIFLGVFAVYRILAERHNQRVAL